MHYHNGKSVWWWGEFDDQDYLGKKGNVHKVERTIVAWHLHAMLWCPNQSDFKEMIHSNMIIDAKLSVDDCKRSRNLFGKNLLDMRGKNKNNAKKSKARICGSPRRPH